MTDSQALKVHNATGTTTATEENPQKLFGICQAVGEAIGIKPIYLRIALLVLLMVSPIAMIAAYAALGGFVVGSWMLFPDAQTESKAEAGRIAAIDHSVDYVEERDLLAA